MNQSELGRALKMVMKGAQAFEARDLKMAMAAIAMAEELNQGGPAALSKALAEARRAIRRDDRPALMKAVSKAAAVATLAPPAEPPPAKARPTRMPPLDARAPSPETMMSTRAAAAQPAEARPAAEPVEVTPAKMQVAEPASAPPAPPVPVSPPPAAAAPIAARPGPTDVPPQLSMPPKPTPAAVPAAAPPASPPARELPPAPATPAILRLGAATHALGRDNLDAAIDALDHALLSSQADPDHDDLDTGEAFIRLGGALAARRAWSKARDALAEGLAIKMRAVGKSNRRIAADLVLLSHVCENLGDYVEARSLAERGLTIRRLQSNVEPRDLADSLVQLGKVALGLEAFGEAAGCFREALALGRDVPADDSWIAARLDQLGLAVARLENAAAARALHEEAFALRRPLLPANHPDIARSLMHIGGFLLEAGAHEEAQTHLQGALEIFEAAGPDEVLPAAQCLEALAVLNVRRQNLEPGRQFLVAAVDKLRAAVGPDHAVVMKFETELAFLTLFTGDMQGAAKLGYATLWRARALHHATLRRDLWYLLSQLAAVRGEFAAAIAFGKLAANAVVLQPGGMMSLETPLQRLFAARHGDVFRHLALLLARAGRLPEASRVLTMLKEDELFDMLHRNPATEPRITQIHLVSTEASWEAEGHDILRMLAGAGREDLPAAEAQRRRQEAEYRFEAWLKSAQSRCTGAAEPDDDHAGLAPLGARVGLLQLMPGPHCLFLLLSTTEFQIAREVAIAAPALRRLALAFRDCVETRGAEVLTLGAELFSHLITPVLPVLQEWGLKTLLIGAEGWLRYVPFPALHDGDQFLAESFSTVMLTEAVPDPVTFRHEGLTIAAMGDAGDAAELRALVRGTWSGGLFPGSIETGALFGAARLSEALADRRLVHIASRLVLDARTPADSHLMLGDGDALPISALAQPPFYFRDVAQIAFTNCETITADGAGDGSETEAVGALLRWRGAGAVLACHWRPAGGPVLAQLTAFYAQRRDGKPAAAALNAAQKQVLAGPEAFRHPYYWAGFFILGGME